MSLWFEHNRVPLGSTPVEAGLLLEERVRGLGLDQFAYILVRPPQACRIDMYSTVMTNYRQEWVERYIEQDYHLVDPVVERVLGGMRPFVWTTRESSPNPRLRRMQAESRDFGVAHGIAYPVRDRHGAVGLFTGVARDEVSVGVAAQHHGEELLAAACDAHEFAVNRAQGGRAGEVGEVDLTSRERECLLWTLEGKTAKEIAALLHLSVFTVNRHAHSATRKLGSLNKHHAAVQAFRAGLI